MNSYTSIQDLDLSGAVIVGFNSCLAEIQGGDLACLDFFGRVVAKFPIELNARYQHIRGLPENIGIDEEGNLEIFEIDCDDEDYFGDEEQPDFILESYSHISTMSFTLVMTNKI